MYKKIFLLVALVILSAMFLSVMAQTRDIGISQNLASGEVLSVNDAKLVLHTKDGDIEVILSAATIYKKIPPEKASFTNAVASSLAEISVGDKVVVTGLVAADKKTMPGKGVYLMTKADISQRHAKEAEQWRTRGIFGKVTAVDPQTNMIKVDVRGLMGATTSVALTPKENAKFRRYAENSVDFNEAKLSSVTEIKPGDMLRALGDRSADGAAFTAEEVISGAFQTVAGPVKAIDAAKNEIVITDFQTKKDITVAVGPTTAMKKFPEDMAQNMALRMNGGAPGQGAGPGPAGPTPPGGGQAAAAPTNPNANGAGPGPGRVAGPGGRGGIDDLLDRFPNITVADLKVGDTIAVSSTKTANPDHITAIKLVSGVEPFIRMAQVSAANGGQQRGGQGVSGSFTIPGLDGIGP